VSFEPSDAQLALVNIAMSDASSWCLTPVAFHTRRIWRTNASYCVMNCTQLLVEWNEAGKLFHSHGLATSNALSLRQVVVIDIWSTSVYTSPAKTATGARHRLDASDIATKCQAGIRGLERPSPVPERSTFCRLSSHHHHHQHHSSSSSSSIIIIDMFNVI